MVIYSEEIEKDVKAGKLPEVTDDNYYSKEINACYLSFHTWLDFHGSPGVPACEAKARAIIEGTYVDEDEDSDAFLIGSYVDAALVGSKGELEKFKEEHAECFTKTLDYALPLDEMKEQYGFMFTKKGKLKSEWTKTRIRQCYPHLMTEKLSLKSQYKRAEKMIERCKKDKLFMAYLSGLHQTIFVFYFCGVPCKCKLDSYIPHKAIVDLKTTRELHKSFWVSDLGRVDFITYYDYVGQLAFYREAVRQCTGETLPTIIAAVSKKDHPEIKLISVDEFSLMDALSVIENSLTTESFEDVWHGKIEPMRCNNPDCDYCHDTEVLTETVNYRDLIFEWGK